MACKAKRAPVESVFSAPGTVHGPGPRSSLAQVAAKTLPTESVLTP